MRENAYKFSRALITVIVTLSMYVGLIFIAIGCDRPSVDAQPSVWWNTTDDNKVRYRFTNDGSAVLQYLGNEYHVPRYNRKGEQGPIEWEWEDDGDIDIKVGHRRYDLDSPYDYANDGEGPGLGTALAVGAGAGLLSKKKKTSKLTAENKKLKDKLKRQKAELARQQKANKVKKSLLAASSKTAVKPKKKYKPKQRKSSKRKR